VNNFDSPIIPGKTLLQETLFLGGLFFLAQETLIWATSYMFTDGLLGALSTAIEFVPLALSVSTVTTTAIAVWRVFRFERQERRRLQEWDARIRALQLENERLRRELDAMRYAVSPEKVESETEGIVQSTAWWKELGVKMLERYYFVLRSQGEEAAIRAISRREMTAAGLCTQHQWNVVNRLLVASGIRKSGRDGMMPATYNEAVGLWLAWVKSRRSFKRNGDDFIPTEAFGGTHGTA